MEPNVSSTLEFEYSKDSITEIASKIISHAENLTVWLFEGEMGAGKTTLIKEIGRQFGVTQTISSPTYSLINEYSDNSGKEFYHFDFYRIKSEDEASDIGSDEYFYSGEYCFVEWPSKIPSLLPDEYYTIQLEIISEEQRKVCLSKKVEV